MKSTRTGNPDGNVMIGHDHILFTGQEVRLCQVNDPLLASRLISMGVFPGTRMRMVRQTLGGRTYLIKAGKHYFAMRKNEVNTLEVEAIVEA